MTPDVSMATVWEALNVISFMATKKRDSKSKQVEMEEQIADLDKKSAQTPSPDLYKERLKLNTEYDIFTSHTIENLLLKNRRNIYEHGDRAEEVLARQLKHARGEDCH